MKGIQRISMIVLIAIMGISIILACLFYFGGSVPETIGTTMEEKSFTSVNLIWGVILFVIAVIITLTFSLINILSNPRFIKNFLLIFGLAALLVIISYLTASSDPLPHINVHKIPTPAMLKWVGTGLNASFILVGIAFLGIIISEILRGIRFLDN
jgi:hypothetical protein